MTEPVPGPYYAAKSHDGSHWIVACPRGAAAVAPPREGQLNQFDFMSEDRAQAYAEQFNREVCEWIKENEEVRIYQALVERKYSWERAADVYRKTQPELADHLARNARCLELLLDLVCGRGIDNIEQLIPGWTPIECPEVDDAEL